MDVDRFLQSLPDVFDGPAAAGRLVDPRFDALTAEVAGFTAPATLAVLNHAARLMPADEAYVEVGAFKGRSMCAAVLDVGPDRRFVSIENFLEFGMLGADAREEMYANLGRHAGHAGVRVVHGDCFRVLAHRSAAKGIGAPVGVYFYDGAHSHLAHYLALGVVERLLADEALVLIDDASWPLVGAATQQYADRHRGWEVVRRFDVVRDDDPRWANGLWALRYRRPAGWRHPAGGGSRMHTDVRWRRQVLLELQTPAAKAAWRTLHAAPPLVPLARRLVPKRSRRIGDDQN